MYLRKIKRNIYLFTKHLYMHDYVTKKGEVKKQFLKLRFIDSFKFLSTSLQNLLDSLTNDQFVETKKILSRRRKKFNLMRGQRSIFDQLNNVHITYQEYERAKSVWYCYGSKNLHIILELSR
ncbi:hypothetical protein NQ317_001088 [Molorchus minor]|uniref:Uncharacterized protein n=1 Tax=Molorchus minor TaxID=1323400 RepID=A0ABQ9JQN4_9CUCU|nr:hypothetical protein NQ317_001088 [Molorchus minor]